MTTITASSILISVVCVLVGTGLVKAVKWLWLKPKKQERWLRQQGIPGTSYRFLVGDMKAFSSLTAQAIEKPMNSFSNDFLPRVDPFRHQLMAKYGKTFFLWAGPMVFLNISKPELVREALTKLHDFQKVKVNPIVDKVFPGLVCYEGEKWAKHRKIINPVFHMEKLKLLLPAFFDSCIEMINKWEEMVAETVSCEIDVWPYLTAFSADVISRAAFGSSYKQGQRIFELLKEQIDLTVCMLESVYIPGMIHIPTSSNRRFKKVDKEIEILLKGIVTKRVEATKAGEATKDDLLGILMDSNFKEAQQSTVSNKNQQHGMSLEEVMDECKLFYLAGQETTSILLVWTLVLLSKHQDWQTRAREEVLQTFGNSVPDFEGLNHLKIVTMILYEVLRLYPPSPQVTRMISKDIKLGELSLLAGTLVNFQIMFTHHDKDLWSEDAEDFKPDRFSEGISKATGGNVAFFPFGWGPRMCIGEKFALTEAKMALAMILQRFSLELSPSYAHAPKSVIFLQPQHGAQIYLHML